MASAVTDLPSDGPALVTSNVLGNPFSVENCSEVHNER
jgi:hypothetical protein